MRIFKSIEYLDHAMDFFEIDRGSILDRKSYTKRDLIKKMNFRPNNKQGYELCDLLDKYGALKEVGNENSDNDPHPTLNPPVFEVNHHLALKLFMRDEIFNKIADRIKREVLNGKI